MGKKKGLALSLGIIIVICMGIFISLQINTPETRTSERAEEYRESKDFGKREDSIHVYEEVEDITKRSEVCYDNLIFLYKIHFYTVTGEIKDIYLSVFSTGDVYSFECPHDFIISEFYITTDNYVVLDDSNWINAQNVIYLGQLSIRETLQLHQYIKKFDINENNLEEKEDELDSGDQNVYESNDLIEEQDRYHTYSCIVRMYWHEQSEEYNRDFGACIIQQYGIKIWYNNLYEKTSVYTQTYNENACAALELIESSGFYNRWIDTFLENYGEILLKEPDPRVETGIEVDDEIYNNN